MYRLNSLSTTITKFYVKSNGKLQAVTLLPRNFVFTDELTDQIKTLEKNGVLKIHTINTQTVAAPALAKVNSVDIVKPNAPVASSVTPIVSPAKNTSKVGHKEVEKQGKKYGRR